MSQDRPDWLNEEFICACLQDGDRDKSINVVSVDITQVVPPGNNYGSYIRRVLVKYRERDSEDIHHRSFIVKGFAMTEAIRETLSSLADMEPVFYQRFLPETYRISPKNDFTPKSFFSPDSSVVVLEDLKDSGYLMADRRKMLDFDHCRLYMIAAAKFHATSVAVYKKNPQLVEMLGNEKIYSNNLKCANPMKKIYVVGIKYLADRMESIDEYKKYSDIVRSSCDAIWDLLVEAHKPNETLNTLNQGDPWITNMMFKYDLSGKVIQIKLLDFQALRYSSPVTDLVFFLWTSARHDVHESMLESLYHVYCNTLNEKLEKFNCSERLSYEQLLENVKLLSPMSLAITCTLPMLINEKPVDVNVIMSESSEESTIRNTYDSYYDTFYCEHFLPKYLKQLESAGVFEYLKVRFAQNS